MSNFESSPGGAFFGASQARNGTFGIPSQSGSPLFLQDRPGLISDRNGVASLRAHMGNSGPTLGDTSKRIPHRDDEKWYF